MEYSYTARKKTTPAQKPARENAAPDMSAELLRAGLTSSAGQPGRRIDLPEAIRAKMENCFGADLSAVQLYESQSVADGGAEAVAQGSRIAFAPGKLNLSSRSGQALLGHELSHIVSQARGEVSGNGFLDNAALEARADREGAAAAAGEQVAPAGGETATVSAAAAGPMQAKKDSDFKAKKAAQPAQRSAEQLERDQAFVGTYGDELQQDTGWDMDSTIEKKGFFARHLGKYFHKNDSAKNVAKNIATGAGLAVAGIPMLLAKGAWAGLKKIGGAIKRSNEEAVDQFNNYDEDYQKMGKWEKFKSFASSPIAWMTAGFRKKGTQERNERREKIRAAASIWRGDNAGRFDDADANFDALNEIPGAVQRDDSGGQAQKDPSMLGYAALGYTGGKFGTMGLKMLNGKATTGSPTAAAYDSVSSAFGAGSAMLNMASSIEGARNQAAVGDKSAAASSGLEAVAYGADMLGSGAQTALKYAGATGSALANNPLLKAATPALGIVSGAANAFSGAVQTGTASAVRANMTDSMAEMDKMGPLTRDQQRIRNSFEQAHGIAKADQTEGIMKSVGGTLQAAGSAATLTGAGATAGAVIGGIGTGVSVLGGMVGSHMRSSVGEDQLEKDLDFTKQVEVVKRRFPNLKLSDREAEDLVLQSMGIMSGDKKEAVQRMTMRRAYALTQAANNKDDVNHDIASRGIAGMGLDKVNGQYSLQGVAQKLGFDKNSSWQEQMQKTRQQGAYYNPFAGRH